MFGQHLPTKQLLFSITKERAYRNFWSLGQEDPLEKEMATHSSILAWKILWSEEPERR